jgi:outer membrane protein
MKQLGDLLKWGGACAACALLAACLSTVHPPLDQRFPEPAVSIDASQRLEENETALTMPASIIDDVPTTPTALQAGPIVVLGVRDVVRTALANNLSIRSAELGRQSGRDGIEASQGIYDLWARLTGSFERSTSGSRRYSGSARSQTLTTRREGLFEAAISQLIPSGAIVGLACRTVRIASRSRTKGLGGGALDSHSKTVQYARTLTLGITQPLLKGFGPDIVNSDIQIARNDANISEEAFRQMVMAQLSGALKAYWDLIFTVNNFDVQKLSLAQAQDLLRINTVKFETGWRPKTDVLQAQAEVAAREEQVLTSQQAIQDVMDVLKYAMNLPRDDREWAAQLIPDQKPTFAEVSHDESQAIAQALEGRPEIRQARLNVENSGIRRRVAKNNRLPSLNVSASVGYVSPDSGEDHDYDNYMIGAELEYPLQNRAARARYRQALANMENREIALRSSEQSITLEVRSSLRAIRTARERIDVTKAAIEFETEKLQSEKERYDVGISTSFQVLEFQEDFARAQVNYLRAVVDYNKALIDFEVARGSLLETLRIGIPEYGVTISDDPAPTRL